MAWIRSIRKLNGERRRTPGRVGLQVDMSATLFQETGTQKKAPKKSKKGNGPEVATFKPTELFRHTVVTYDLAEAIRDGIVKKPILERVEVRERAHEARSMPSSRTPRPNAWEKYRNLLTTGIERWKKVRDQLADEGDPPQAHPLRPLQRPEGGAPRSPTTSPTVRRPTRTSPRPARR